MVAEPMLVTHTGSLPRGPELAQALWEEQRSGLPRSSRVREEAAVAVRDAVRRQFDVGIDIVGDGELGKVGFQIYLPQRMRGFGGASNRNPHSDIVAFPEYEQMYQTGRTPFDPPAATGELEYVGHSEAHEDVDQLVAALAGTGHSPDVGFMSAPSPGIVATTFRNKHYDSYEDYLSAIVTQVRPEYEIVLDAGLILQIDAPDLAMERGMYYMDDPIDVFLEATELHIEALNQAIQGLPRDRIRLHCCWGNQASPHTHDVELEVILPIISRARVGALGLAFANPRHQHEIDVLARHGLPDDMILIAGVIDSTTNYVEHPEVVSQRLQAAARAMGDPARVIASPDCGFGTFAVRNAVATDVMWAKFETLRQGADRAIQAL